jgi:hypothetical protein
MKKIIIVLLCAFCTSLHAQFTETKEEAFVGAENLLNNTIARKYMDGAGNMHEIVKVSFTEKAILVTERIKEKGSRQYGDAIENSFYKIPWSDIGIFEFIVTPSSHDLLELKINFKSSLSYKIGSNTEQITNTMTLMVLAKDKDEMDKFMKSIQHFCVKE